MAPTRTNHQNDRDTAIARGVVYGFLARALAFPTRERLAELLDTAGPLASMVTAGEPQLGAMARAAVAALAHPEVELRRAHTLAFPPIESREHPPYESAYVSADVFVQTEVMADVAAFYRAHGLRIGGHERERPDHICVELEFVGFMAQKEAYALDQLGPAQIAECRRTQTHFLRDHLSRWAPAFGDRLALSATDEPYPQLGRLLRTWMEFDCASVGVALERQLDRPHPPPPPDDGSCGLDAVGLDTPASMRPAAATPVPLPDRRGRSRP